MKIIRIRRLQLWGRLDTASMHNICERHLELGGGLLLKIYVQSPKLMGIVRLQTTTGRYRTNHGQTIPTDFIEEFTHI